MGMSTRCRGYTRLRETLMKHAQSLEWCRDFLKVIYRDNRALWNFSHACARLSLVSRPSEDFRLQSRPNRARIFLSFEPTNILPPSNIAFHLSTKIVSSLETNLQLVRFIFPHRVVSVAQSTSD